MKRIADPPEDEDSINRECIYKAAENRWRYYIEKELEESVPKKEKKKMKRARKSKVGQSAVNSKKACSKKRYLFTAVIALFLFGNSIWNIVSEKIEDLNSQKKIEKLQESILRPFEGYVSEEHQKMDRRFNGEEIFTSEEQDLDILYQYSRLYKRNPDLIGWVTINGTVINYPVMQTRDEEYYLHKDYDKEYDRSGLPFMDARCDVTKTKNNLLIYAHNMKNGSMFATLLRYKDQDFYENHKIIRFDSIYEEAEYEVIAAFQTEVAFQGEDTFRYYEFTQTNSKEEFDNYLYNIKNLSYYDTEVTAEFGDSLLTLSTCDRSKGEGRFVVVAKKLVSELYFGFSY